MTTPATNAKAPVSGGASPLPILLALSFLCSVGTGIATNGVYFLTSQSYHFSTGQNYALGFFQGLTYVVAAVFAGRVVRWLRKRLGLSSRGILALIIGLLGALCFIPLAAAKPSDPAPAAWPIWAMVMVYSPLTGFLWPLVEGYVSGGRSGVGLRRSLGTWNLWWSSALVLGYFMMGPLIGRPGEARAISLSPQQLLAALGMLHILTTLLLLKLSPDPGRHLHEEHEPHPPVYRELLGTFRVLLPTSYFVLTALQPYLPKALTGLGVAERWAAPLASTWLFARVVTFFALDRWHGWHGRWTLAVASIVLLIGGFAATFIGPTLRGSTPDGAIALSLAGLFAFGIGMATTYTAALYYAMEVGQSDVDAGGTHESLIGLGYSAGPAIGLLASSWAGPATTAKPGDFERGVVLLVGCMALAAFVFAAWLTHRNTRGVPR